MGFYANKNPPDFSELELRRAVNSCGRSRPGSPSQERARAMIVVNKNLLKEVQRLAIKDELFTMRLRGVLVVVPVIEKPVVKPGDKG